MEFRSLRSDVDGRIATITLDRPRRLNAIDEHLPAEIRAAVESAQADRGVHVIVVTGHRVGMEQARRIRQAVQDPIGP